MTNETRSGPAPTSNDALAAMAETAEIDYARQLGERLRAVRERRHWSLHDVEDASGSEFRSGALGTYERGERFISVARLHRLARLYRVSIDRMLPPEVVDLTALDRLPDPNGADEPGAARGSLVLDLVALERSAAPELAALKPYLETIKLHRGLSESRMLSVRGSDIWAMAAICWVDPDGLIRRLEQLGAVVRIPASS
jgi:transcriptional regulator with XRE-family HTH domain